MSRRRLGRLLPVVPLLVALAAPFIGSSPTAQALTPSAVNWVAQGGAAVTARSGAALAYDPAGHMVLFGGSSSPSSYLGDTWTWNGSGWTQSGAVSPTPRGSAAMVYDPAMGVDLLFGGINSGGYFNDTYTWNGSSWTQLHPIHHPSSRYAASIAYDAANGTVVLFGGYDGVAPYSNETWTWNGTDWTQRFPNHNPSVRLGASMAYDAATGNVVLFGGTYSNALNDTWTWNGTDWTQQSPSTNPPARDVAAMDYDAATGQVVLFGGYGTSSSLGDTWTWNGSDWSAVSPSNSPGPRSSPAMAYVPSTGQELVVGGNDAGSFLADTWALDTTPNAPSGVTGSFANSQSTVSWTPPSLTGGLPIINYVVSATDETVASRGGQSCSSSTVTSCTVVGLTNGDNYFFTVSATNTLGTGPSSLASNITTPRTVPGAPSVAKVVAGPGDITVTWRPPVSNGGSPITGFVATALPGSHSCVAGSPSATSCTITGLTHGVSYSVLVTASNAAGAGPNSAPSAPVSPSATRPLRRVPGPPQINWIVITTASITLNWKAPSSHGSSRILGYKVYVGTVSHHESKKPLNAKLVVARHFTWLPSKRHHRYYFIVKAVNAVGVGKGSNQVVATSK